MGRKKKRFIDKKNAHTFHLVSRSQSDPLYGQPEESQYVLKPETPRVPVTEDERVQEQQKYGVYYQDEYDYLQHLRQPETAVLEPTLAETQKKVQLPPEIFGTEVHVEGKLSKVLPLTGPQPDWDPDIVAALDSAEVVSDAEDPLEDDFVLKANGGEPGLPVYVTEHYQDGVHGGGQAPWWMSKGDFHPMGAVDEPVQSASCSESGTDSQVNSQDGSQEEFPGAMPEVEKSARFTEYSISSSVVPRNDALTLLDDKFEQFMVEYDCSQLGAAEEEEEDEGGEGGEASAVDQRLLEGALQDFEKNYTEQLISETEGGVAGPNITQATRAAGEGDETDEEERDGSSTSGSDSERELMEVEERRGEQWDCESILSTYSNLYNHPTKIVEPRVDRDRITVSNKTGIPLGIIPGPAQRESLPKQASVSRPRDENREDKKVRKQALKAERKNRRAEKKATKLLFKTEHLKQQRTLSSQMQTAAVV